MTPPDKLVQAAAEAIMQANDWQGMAAANEKLALELATRDAKAALAAAFAVLPEWLLENVDPAVWAHRMPSGNFHRFHDKNTAHMDGCQPMWDYDTLAREFGEPT